MNSKNNISDQAPSAKQINDLFDAICPNTALADIEAILKERPDAANWSFPSTLTPLIQATRMCRHDIMELLLDYKADINAKTGDGYSAMIYAGWHGDAKGAAILKSAGANIDDSLKDGKTALILAIDNEKTQTALGLIALGADVNIRHDNGSTALISAAYRVQSKVCAALIRAGADLLAYEDDTAANALDIAEFTARNPANIKAVETLNVLRPAYDALKRKTDHAVIDADLKSGAKTRIKIIPKIRLKR